MRVYIGLVHNLLLKKTDSSVQLTGLQIGSELEQTKPSTSLKLMPPFLNVILDKNNNLLSE